MGARLSKIGGAGCALLVAIACFACVATSRVEGAESGGNAELSGVFEVVHGAFTGSGVKTKLKVKRCPTEVAIAGGHARLPAEVTVRAPAHSGNRLLAYAAVNGSVLPAPRKWECTAALGVDGTETIAAGPGGSVIGRHGGSPHLRKGGESVQAELIPACEGCIATTICSFFPRADVVKIYESTLECDAKAAGELRFRLSRSAVLFVDPPGVKGASAQSGGALPSIGVVGYRPSTGARQLDCTLTAAKAKTCAAAIVAFLSLGRRG